MRLTIKEEISNGIPNEVTKEKRTNTGADFKQLLNFV